jgi:hypothetical protein
MEMEQLIVMTNARTMQASFSLVYVDATWQIQIVTATVSWIALMSALMIQTSGQSAFADVASVTSIVIMMAHLIATTIARAKSMPTVQWCHALFYPEKIAMEMEWQIAWMCARMILPNSVLLACVAVGSGIVTATDCQPPAL